MKSIIIAGVIIVVAAVAGFVLISGKDNSGENKNETVSTNASDMPKVSGKPACELITLEDAKSLIGDNAVLSDASPVPDLATTEEVSVDNCTYSSDGATLGDFKQITIQRHFGDSGQVKQAYDNYQKEFPGEALSGLGETAYYATEAKQVQVLKGDYWLYIAGGSINAGDEANKELELKAAELAVNKL